MNDNLTLAVAQEKLKCEIAAGRDRTLTALIFARTGHVIRLVIRAQKPISWVYSAIGLNLVLVLGATLLLAMTRWGGSYWLSLISLEQGFLGLILGHVMTSKIFTDIRDYVTDAINAVDDLSDLQEWLAGFYAVRKSFAFAMIFGVAWGLFVAISRGGLFSFSHAIGGLVYGFLIGIPIYAMLVMLKLPARSSRYRYQLYDFAPANSKIISHLSQIFNTTSLAIAIFSATGVFIVVLFVDFSQDLRELAGPVLAGWIPVMVLFMSGQAALRNIVTTGKWRTMDELQIRISNLQAEGDMSKQETIDAINRLVDLQERVAATRDSAFSARVVLNTLKDLLLPVLGSILASSTQLQALLSQW